MEKSKVYSATRFSVETLEEASNYILNIEGVYEKPWSITAEIHANGEMWNFDTLEEFFANYNKTTTFHFVLRRQHPKCDLDIISSEFGRNLINVGANERRYIESVFQIFERDLQKSKIVLPDTPIKVFVGHGGDGQWRLLKDHLHDLHNFDVIAYEIGPRAGLTVKEVLEKMLNDSSIAFLILTGEDEKNYGELHARQNVVHELGLFQGKLGFSRAIAVLEEGTTEFSNINGINQIRFSKGNIRETYGEVVATINREFKQ
jgi:predicted nucleotide-binding protein